jgi:lysophospholipase L1-like esterase
MQEKMEKFYAIIREKQPHTPILFIEDPLFPRGNYNRALQHEVEEKNKTVRAIFDRLKARGDAHIEFLSSLPMIGSDNEATVDGIHFTDLGFMRYADYLQPYIEKYLEP